MSLSEVGLMDGFHEKVHKNQSVAASIKASITFETATFDVSHIKEFFFCCIQKNKTIFVHL